MFSVPSLAAFASEIRRCGAGTVLLPDAEAAAVGFLEPVCCETTAALDAAADVVALLLRRDVFGCCGVSWDTDESESELDELESEPLELPLDEDEPELEPELESELVVDCRNKCSRWFWWHLLVVGWNKCALANAYLLAEGHGGIVVVRRQ